MEDALIAKFEWSLFENSRVRISCDEVRGQKVAIDGTAWCQYCGCVKEQRTNSDNNKLGLSRAFWQLYHLTVEQVQALVVFEKCSRKQDNNFVSECMNLLRSMNIPYIEVNRTEPALVALVKEKIVDGCMTENPLVFACGLVNAYRFSDFEDTVARKQTIQLLRYSISDTNLTDHLFCFHVLTSFLFPKDDGDGDDHPDDVDSTKAEVVPTVRPIMTRACKKPYTQPPVSRRTRVGKVKVVSVGERKNKKEAKDFSDINLVFEKLNEVVQSWSDNLLERLDKFQAALANGTTEHLTELERELMLFQDCSGKKSLGEYKTDLERGRSMAENVDRIVAEARHAEWKRPDMNSLQSFLVSKVNLVVPLKQLLGFVVAYDLFELLSSHTSGDSYPEGISRPDKVTKLLRENDEEMYDVKWLYIPGADDLKSKDLVTRELKNVFSAAFPKVASKFEGWNLKSSTDEDEGDDSENLFDDARPIDTPDSPKKRLKNRKRRQEESVETPASTGSNGAKTTMKHFFVARKRLTFDPMK